MGDPTIPRTARHQLRSAILTSIPQCFARIPNPLPPSPPPQASSKEVPATGSGISGQSPRISTDHGKSGTASQSPWLETESFIDLTSTSIGYIGCGAIFHGLTYAATVHGQADAGDRGLTLSPACTDAMLYNVALAAERNASSLTSESSGVYTDAVAICVNIAIPIPAVCHAFFTQKAYVQTFVFASPEITSIWSDTPAASNFTNPLASWSPEKASYSPRSMKSYNNLTTAISPVITTMFTNQTFSNSTSDLYAGVILSCLRPANISQNSTTPSQIPNGGAANLHGAMVSPSASSTIAVASVMPSSGADKLRLMMDWMCMLGIGTLCWRVMLI